MRVMPQPQVEHNFFTHFTIQYYELFCLFRVFFLLKLEEDNRNNKALNCSHFRRRDIICAFIRMRGCLEYRVDPFQSSHSIPFIHKEPISRKTFIIPFNLTGSIFELSDLASKVVFTCTYKEMKFICAVSFEMGMCYCAYYCTPM